MGMMILCDGYHHYPDTDVEDQPNTEYVKDFLHLEAVSARPPPDSTHGLISTDLVSARPPTHGL